MLTADARIYAHRHYQSVFPLPEWPDLKEWKQERLRIRRHLLLCAGLNHSIYKTTGLTGAAHILTCDGRRKCPEHHILIVVRSEDSLASVLVATDYIRHIPCISAGTNQIFPTFIGKIQTELLVAFVHVSHCQHQKFRWEITVRSIAANIFGRIIVIDIVDCAGFTFGNVEFFDRL